jgi:ubiquinol-cytochrome c reductase cytochrome b subunit
MKTHSSKTEHFSQWVNARFPLNKFMDWSLHEEIPGGASFSYIFGSLLLFLLGMQAITGILLMTYYVPSTNYAYQSLSYLQLHVPFGWLIYNMHYWGANLFTIVIGLHMIRVFIWGSYKKPRELIWLIGIVLALLTAGFMFTGPILAWNRITYWAGEVGLSMAGTIPIFGKFAQSILQGEGTIGQVTLTRLFAFHVMILFPLILLFIGLHLIAFRQQGSSGTWNQVKRKIKGLFWPDQILKDTIVMFIAFVFLIWLCVYFPVPFYGMADPKDTFFSPKPAWPFLFLYQTLKFFKGRLEPVGIVGVPIILILLLVLLPFLDRKEERNPRKRPFVMICGFVFVSFILTMLFFGYRSKPASTAIHAVQSSKVSFQQKDISQKTEKQQSFHSDSVVSNLIVKKDPKKTSKSQKTTNNEFETGKKIFTTVGCLDCHTANGKPSHKAGPDLILALRKNKRNKKWLYTQLVSPQKNDPDTFMPSYSYIGKAKILALVSFLKGLETTKKPIIKVISKSQKKSLQSVSPKSNLEKLGKAVAFIGDSHHGKILYDNFCLKCHGPQGKTYASGFHAPPGVPPLNPISRNLYNSNQQIFVNNIDSRLQNGRPNPANGPDMPAFGDSHSLTQPEISDIEAYILHLNGVNRTEIIHPGVKPKSFFFIVLEIGILMVLFLIIYRLLKKVPGQ